MIGGMGEKEEEVGKGKGRRTGIDMQNEQKNYLFILKKNLKYTANFANGVIHLLSKILYNWEIKNIQTTFKFNHTCVY